MRLKLNVPENAHSAIKETLIFWEKQEFQLEISKIM